MSFQEGEQLDLTAHRKRDLLFGPVLAGVVSPFYIDVRLKSTDETTGCTVVKDDHYINHPEGGEQVGAFLLRLDWVCLTIRRSMTTTMVPAVSFRNTRNTHSTVFAPHAGSIGCTNCAS